VWDFSGDEALFFMAAGSAAIIGLIRWYAPLVRQRKLAVPHRYLLTFALLPLVAIVPTYAVLQTIADPVYVVGHIDYILLFLTGGVAWLMWWTRGLVLLGIETPVEAVANRNLASVFVIVGGMLGIGCVYAGSNIGGGPTIWTTLLPALVATLTLFALGGILERFTDTADAVAIDRDVATAVRTGTLFACVGVILGRAMGGDWSTWSETFMTFAVLAWPALMLTLGTAFANRFAAPTPQRPVPGVVAWGVVPAGLLVALTAAYLVALGGFGD
jgi:hypothetical protein